MIVPAFGRSATLFVTLFILVWRGFMARQVAVIASHYPVQFFLATEYLGTSIAVRIEFLIASTISINGPDERIAMYINDIGRLGVGDIHVVRIGRVRHKRQCDYHTRHGDDYVRLNDDLRLRGAHLHCGEKSHRSEGQC